MTKNTVKHLIINIIVAGGVTAACIALSGYICGYIENSIAISVVKLIFTAIWVIFDLTMLVWFLFYWWCEIKWRNVKRRFGK